MALFSDTFVDNRNGWSIGPSNASDVEISGGQLSIAMKTANIFNIGPVPKTLPADVDVTFDSVVENNAGTGTFLGAVCRVQPGKNFYMFQVFIAPGAGLVVISKVVNGQLTILDGPTSSQIIQLGQAKNTIRMVCSGDQLHLSVNGTELATAQDNTLKEGGVALYSQATAAGAKVAFSNLVINAP